MTEAVSVTRTPAFEVRLRKRYAAEKRFRAAGLGAILLSIAVLVFLLVTMTMNGIGGFQRVTVQVPVDFGEVGLTVPVGMTDRAAIVRSLQDQGLPDLVEFSAEQALGEEAAGELGADAWRVVAERTAGDPALLSGAATFSLPVGNRLAAAYSGDGQPDLAPLARALAAEGKLSKDFDPGFLIRSDATDPQQAGIWGALKGSMLTMLVTLSLAFPIGVLAALYLEEYAPRSRWTEVIEVSINNLAAVPSIIFGLLGLAVFLNTMNLPRSAPLVGGLTLALMTMPVIVIAGRNALTSVPPSIREAALGVGASKMQVVFHHVLPLALPGILTGTIIGLARALGETAPLLMIGMRAFIAVPPSGITDPSSVLPVQIFLWSDEVDRSFIEKTSAAIIVLLMFMLLMNALAIYLRNRFEQRW